MRHQPFHRHKTGIGAPAEEGEFRAARQALGRRHDAGKGGRALADAARGKARRPFGPLLVLDPPARLGEKRKPGDDEARAGRDGLILIAAQPRRDIGRVGRVEKMAAIPIAMPGLERFRQPLGAGQIFGLQRCGKERYGRRYQRAVIGRQGEPGGAPVPRRVAKAISNPSARAVLPAAA